MKKYISFSGESFNFLLAIDNVIELYDAEASSESLSSILAGEDGNVYWRGMLSTLIDIDRLMNVESPKNNHCYIVCSDILKKDGYFILSVKSINELIDLSENNFRTIDIANAQVKAIAEQVCIMSDREELFFLLRDFSELFESFDHVESYYLH